MGVVEAGEDGLPSKDKRRGDAPAADSGGAGLARSYLEDAASAGRRDTAALRLAMAVSTVLAGSLFLAPRALASGQVDATTLAGRLAQRPVVLQGATITGDLDLRRKRVHGFSCHDCRFGGSLLAVGARVSGKLDLTGSEIGGDVDLRDARLAGDFLALRATLNGLMDLRGATLQGAELSRTRFQAPLLAGDDISSPTTFGGPADFALADFSSRVTFENAVFKSANFRFATFAADAIFANAHAVDATFARAIFRGASDFSGCSFDRAATFQGADFEGPADFSLASFGGDVSFDQSRLAQGATFVAAAFTEPAQATGKEANPGQPTPVDLSHFASRSDLDFSFAEFDRPLIFTNVLVAGTLSFSNAIFAVSKGVSFDRVSAQNLEMSVGDTLRAVRSPTQRQAVLSEIEASAKEHGNLGLANDALYARQELKSDRYWLPWRVLDFAFYRWIAGYFVRPLRPLAWLLILALVASVLRDATFKEERRKRLTAMETRLESYRRLRRSRKPRPREAGDRIVWGFRDLGGTFADIGRAFRNTLFLIVPGSSRTEARQGRQGEVFLYGVLLACALVGFANSNPTLRQMFDAIH
jgi:uncharacterized protein YjbI with pentapeptide repeats